MEIVTDSNEWVRKADGVATVGITVKAGKEIGEIVHILFPKVGTEVQKGEEVVILESTKAAIDSYAPLSGKILEVNELLVSHPQLINSDPEGLGWLYKLALPQGIVSEN